MVHVQTGGGGPRKARLVVQMLFKNKAQGFHSFKWARLILSENYRYGVVDTKHLETDVGESFSEAERCLSCFDIKVYFEVRLTNLILQKKLGSLPLYNVLRHEQPKHSHVEHGLETEWEI